jgi:predicted aldo/keto reductase-like oxidoreductase
LRRPKHYLNKLREGRAEVSPPIPHSSNLSTRDQRKMVKKPVDRIQFGAEDTKVTVVGLGGEGILRTFGKSLDAEQVILEALLQGINYFDSGRVYAGSEGYYGTIWSKHPETRSKIFQASKSASRDKRGAKADLQKTLETLGTDHLNLWQIHDVRTEDDYSLISGPGGALEAFLEAKKAGQTRFIGVTGHHDPYLLTKAITEWPLDSVMMPINPVEGALSGFLDLALPAAKKKGMAVIAMKVLGSGHYIFPDQGITADVLIRFALSQEITVAIVGCASRKEVQTLAHGGRDWKPFSPEEQKEIIDFFRPYAAKLAHYRGVL